VQPVRRDELAVETMGALKDTREFVNSFRRGWVGKDGEKQSTTTTACKLVHDRLEQIMNELDWQPNQLYCRMHYRNVAVEL